MNFAEIYILIIFDKRLENMNIITNLLQLAKFERKYS